MLTGVVHPHTTKFTDVLAIKSGRHPLLDQATSNDVFASEDYNYFLITGRKSGPAKRRDDHSLSSEALHVPTNSQYVGEDYLLK